MKQYIEIKRLHKDLLYISLAILALVAPVYVIAQMTANPTVSFITCLWVIVIGLLLAFCDPPERYRIEKAYVKTEGK